jgi:hypothetical protein
VIVKTVVLEYLDMGEYGPDGEPHEHAGGSGEVWKYENTYIYIYI